MRKNNDSKTQKIRKQQTKKNMKTTTNYKELQERLIVNDQN